jgi:zinc transport system substrate-binding protein
MDRPTAPPHATIDRSRFGTVRRAGRLPRAAAGVVAALLISASGAAADEIEAVATIKPIHSLLSAVLGDKGKARLLVDGAASPHSFALKPSDAKSLNNAALVVRVGDGLEPFMARVVRSLPKRVKVVTLEGLAGLTLHPVREGGNFDAHGHAHGKKGGHSHGHGHRHAKGGKDAHIWLDPRNGIRIAAHLAEVLAGIAPRHAEAFKANAAGLAAELKSLDSELEAELTAVSGKPFIVFHDAYQYFEKRYAIPAAGSVTVSADTPPSAKRLRALRTKIAALGPTCIFAEPQFEPKIVATLIEGGAARSGVLDPLGASLANGPALYPALLRNLSKSIRACLADR